MKNKIQVLLAILTLVLLTSLKTFAQQGAIAGKIIDKETGEELIGAAVMIVQNGKGASTDIEGRYTLKAEPGTYDLVCTYVSYRKLIITGIVVKAGQTTNLDLLAESENVSLEEVVVEARKIQNTDASLLSMQKKSNAVQDGVSAQQIGRTGSSNAAESMKQITGASVEDGKYLVMRGLGDRYSISQLNGLTMVSNDPYRNSSSMDLIPSSIIDNIVTVKTFTPDQPGNFAGGNLNVTTRDFPDKFNLSLSLSTSYNTQSSLINNFLTYKGGKYDNLGFDDGTRALPVYLNDEQNRAMLSNSSYLNARNASPDNDAMRNIFHNSARDLNMQFVPTQRSTPLNTGVNFSIGNKKTLFGRDFGFTFGTNYSHDFRHFNNGKLSTYQNTLNEDLFAYQALSQSSSTENAQLGTFLNLSYKLAQNHIIGANIIYSNSGEKEASQLSGSYLGQVSNSEAVFHTNVLAFKQQQMGSVQLNGKHKLVNLLNAEIEWNGNVSKSLMQEPDLRSFSYITFPEEVERYDEEGNYLQTETITSYNINNAEFSAPYHFFRDLQDNQAQFKTDITIPLSTNNSNSIKFGGLYSKVDREFGENRFELNNTQVPVNLRFNTFEGDFDALFSPENFGIIDTTYNGDGQVSRYTPGYYYMNQVNNKNFYTGYQKVSAVYAMTVLNINSKLKFIGGARLEATNIFSQSKDTTIAAGKINEVDVLPSLNFVYSLSNKSNLRIAASQTLARPNLREISPFTSLDPKTGINITGNPDLKRTLIQNYDVRWELFPNLEDMIAVSAYYKNFDNPIIFAFIPSSTTPEYTWKNVENAKVYGLEFELRKSLGFIGNRFKNFTINTNFTLIHSESVINPDEYAASKNLDSEYDQRSRPFQGQSPFIVNAMLTYQNFDLGLESTISYNVAGKRLYNIGVAATPDVYEASVPMLNYKLSKDLGKYFQASFTARNLLNSKISKEQEYKGKTYTAEGYQIGTTFQLGLSYRIK